MIDAPATLPLAALGDFIEAIVPLLVMVFWIANQLFGGKRKPKPAAPRPRPPQPAQPPFAADPGKPPALEDTLRKEVEEFMRRAQGRAAPKQQSRPAVKGDRPAPPRREVRPAKPAAAERTPLRRLTDAPGAQTSGSGPQPPREEIGAGVAAHLAGAQALAAHAQQLGADVAQADERMEEHLQSRFAHKLGALAPRAMDPQRSSTRSPLAQDLLKLLAQPGGARQVILASEILRRPEERWGRRASIEI